MKTKINCIPVQVLKKNVGKKKIEKLPPKGILEEKQKLFSAQILCEEADLV